MVVTKRSQFYGVHFDSKSQTWTALRKKGDKEFKKTGISSELEAAAASDTLALEHDLERKALNSNKFPMRMAQWRQSQQNGTETPVFTDSSESDDDQAINLQAVKQKRRAKPPLPLQAKIMAERGFDGTMKHEFMILFGDNDKRWVSASEAAPELVKMWKDPKKMNIIPKKHGKRSRKDTTSPQRKKKRKTSSSTSVEIKKGSTTGKTICYAKKSQKHGVEIAIDLSKSKNGDHESEKLIQCECCTNCIWCKYEDGEKVKVSNGKGIVYYAVIKTHKGYMIDADRLVHKRNYVCPVGFSKQSSFPISLLINAKDQTYSIIKVKEGDGYDSKYPVGTKVEISQEKWNVLQENLPSRIGVVEHVVPERSKYVVVFDEHTKLSFRDVDIRDVNTEIRWKEQLELAQLRSKEHSEATKREEAQAQNLGSKVQQLRSKYELANEEQKKFSKEKELLEKQIFEKKRRLAEVEKLETGKSDEILRIANEMKEFEAGRRKLEAALKDKKVNVSVY